MDTIEQLKVLARVVESGSFSRTAAELGLGQPAVSRAVGALEQRFGARLLHRSTRSLSLTEEGQRVYERSLRILEQFETLDGAALPASGRRRRVRVSCPMAFGTLRLIQLITHFGRVHPEVEVDLRLSDSMVDLVEDGIDVAFRFGTLHDSAYTAKKLGYLPRLVVASDNYLRQHGTPRRPEELTDHHCVVRGRQTQDAKWSFRSKRGPRSVQVSGPLRVDNYLALREAVLAGAGLGLAGTFVFYEQARLHPTLRQVLKPFQIEPLGVQLVFQKDRFLPSRVRTFIDHFVDVMAREPWLASSR